MFLSISSMPTSSCSKTSFISSMGAVVGPSPDVVSGTSAVWSSRTLNSPGGLVICPSSEILCDEPEVGEAVVEGVVAVGAGDSSGSFGVFIGLGL